MTGMGELSSEVSRRMWLGMYCTEQGFSTVQQIVIPGILDPSIDGEALGAIKFVVCHLVGVCGHSDIAYS